MTTTERNNIEEHADLLYSVYCEAVGGVAFNGDPLPEWASFAADPKKKLQADGWRSVAKQSLDLEGTLETARELHRCELDNVKNLMHYVEGKPGHVALSGYALQVRDNILEMKRERDAAIAVLEAIEERYVDGCNTYEDWRFMGKTALDFLLNNHQNNEQ